MVALSPLPCPLRAEWGEFLANGTQDRTLPGAIRNTLIDHDEVRRQQAPADAGNPSSDPAVDVLSRRHADPTASKHRCPPPEDRRRTPGVRIAIGEDRTDARESGRAQAATWLPYPGLRYRSFGQASGTCGSEKRTAFRSRLECSTVRVRLRILDERRDGAGDCPWGRGSWPWRRRGGSERLRLDSVIPKAARLTPRQPPA